MFFNNQKFEIKDGILIRFKDELAESAVIPDNVTEIGKGAFFNHKYLREVVIPNGVQVIGQSAFEGCEALNALELPPSIRTIQQSAFQRSGIGNIVIPEGVALIQTETFRSCSELTSVTLPKSLTSIHISAFENCENLSNVTLPQNLSDIGKSAFGGCESLVRVTFSEGLSHIGHSAFDGTAINELDLPESLEKIDAMSIGIHLTKITIPYHIEKFSPFDPIELSLQPNNKPLTIIIRRDGKSYAFLVDKKETARPEFWSELKSKCM